RGRLFLGIGGRDHFGIRGRIASEFACQPLSTSRYVATSPKSGSPPSAA
ncbi:hypothetical protein GOC37_33190, partial [Sinorhizobium meliloti]|nr:hypothetical protein [Sinorhizobium meliloti]